MAADLLVSRASLPLHASPAFSTTSKSTFASSSSGSTLLPPSPHPNIRPTNSDGAVAQLRQERELECAPAPEEEGEELKLDRKLRGLALDSDSAPADCDCDSSPASPDLDAGRFTGIDERIKADADGNDDGKESRSKRERAARPPRQRRESESVQGKEFDRFGIPSPEAIKAATECHLAGESGETVQLEHLIRARGTVVVVFLRHLWCGLCAQYVTALRRATTALASASTTTVSTASDTRPPLYVLLISSGSPSLISIYRSRLNCPFPLYVDQRRSTYKALGMTLKTLSGGRDRDKGSYITKSAVENVVSSTINGLTMRANPGSQRQLGGEFVFSVDADTDEIRCTYASRMNTTRSHSEVRDLFAAAGVHLTPEDEASVFGGSSYNG